jgi:hypothetical protein
MLGLHWSRIAGPWTCVRHTILWRATLHGLARRTPHVRAHFKICFRWGKRKLKKTVKTTARSEAEAALARFEENLRLLERGRIELPVGADIGTFLMSDGKLTGKPSAAPPPRPLTLGELRDFYIAVHSNGAMEANSLDTVRMHLGHFVRTLGESFSVGTLEASHLQGHVNQRAQTLSREIAQCHYLAKGDGELSGLLELGSADRQTKRGIPSSWAQVSQDGGKATVSNASGDRTSDRPWWAICGPDPRALGVPIPRAARDRSTARTRPPARHATVSVPDGLPCCPHGGPAERAAAGASG